MTDRFETELAKIDKFLDKMMSIAESDGEISTDEQEILDEVLNEVSEYRLMVFDAQDNDGVIDDAEMEKMKGYRERILNLVNRKAMRDGIITDEERDLIDSLFEFVND
ncbi:MAG: hypothetical protein INQ03_14210 [Candidatus Heimdallarchaeota archaeon]|nr:hypothetical protein [Candidatus Heimdallarchaeota archaeon]